MKQILRHATTTRHSDPRVYPRHVRDQAAYLNLAELRGVRIDQVLVPASDHDLWTANVDQTLQQGHSDSRGSAWMRMPLIQTWRVTVISVFCSYPSGLFSLSSLSKIRVTLAFCTPAWPCLYTSSCKLAARTCARERPAVVRLDSLQATRAGPAILRQQARRGEARRASVGGAHLREVGDAQHEADRV